MSCQQQVTQPITTTTASSVTTTEDQDPYVFTETVPTTPPILFNAQKTRTRVLIDTTQTTTKPTTPTPNAPTIATQQTTPTTLTRIVTTTAVTNKQRATPNAATANANKFKFQQKLPLSPLNGNNTQKTQTPTTLAAATGQNGSSAAAASAMAKVTTPSIVKTTITQSHNQLQQQQQQLKKALNVCIVRPQQQQLPPTARQQHQQILKAQQQQQRKQASSPPPLLQHTPSLWQTPLLLDTATAVVSPPTSPASLPSPPVAGTLTITSSSPSPTAATALVSPLISAGASTLPPSNFHHNTMAQHLQKVECLKKPKKTLANNENDVGSTTTEKQQPAAMSKPQQQQSQRREVVGAKTVVVQPTSILLHPNPNQQHQQHPAQMLKPNVATSSAPPPLQAIQAVAVPQHSDNDLNEIPVNVIFRKPQSTEILHSQLGGCKVSMTAVGHSENSKAAATSITSLVSTVKKGLTPAKSKNVRALQTTNMQSKSKSNAVVTDATPSLLPAPHVLRDIVFTHTGTGELAASKPTSPHTLPAHTTPTQQHYRASATVINKQQQQQQKNMSSMAKFSAPQLPTQQAQQSYKYDNVSLTQFASKTISDTQSQCINAAAVKAANTMNRMGASKNMSKRKMTATPIATSSTAAAAPHTALSLPFLKKRSRKIGPLYSQSDNEMFLQCTTTTVESGSSNVIGRRNSHAVAVLKLSAAEIEADTTLLASSTVLPYCIQKHWLYITRELQLVGGVCGVDTQAVAAAATAKGVGALLTSASERETRITQRKTILRRQALQLLATHSLQKLPLQAARRRLLCVDRLLRKYERHGNNEIIAHKKCNYADCAKTVLEMATQCEDHIVDNISQHIFLPCTAKFADNTQCRIPVFDIIHDLPLCGEHARKRDAAYNRGVHVQQRSQTNNKFVSAVVASTLNKTSVDSGDTGDLLLQLQQIQQQHKQQQQQQLYNNAAMSKIKKSTNIKVNSTRKRKAPSTTGPNAAVRPLKRPKKMVTNSTPSTMSPVVATAAAATVAPTQLTSAVLQRKSSTTSLESIASNSQSSNSQPHYISSNMNMQGGGQTKIAMPALAPLSGRNMPVVSSTVSPPSVPPKHTLSFGFVNNNDGGGNIVQATNDVISQDFKPHEISQLVAQFSVAVNSNNNRNNNYNSNTNENSNTLNTYSNNSISNSYNTFIGTNCDSNFTSALGSTSSLPSSTEELFRQELLSVCENSSVYASSEDTGLGGLSETELMVGPNDADDIPLGDTRLLEEHDLANVLSALPEDAFNELFTAVHQEEREEVERALELADKHLKSLQQTIGTDIDFLGDFPDDDEILADTNAIVSSVMRSPDATSGIDTSTLFIDSGSNSAGGGGGGGSINSSNLTDIRGLVQT